MVPLRDHNSACEPGAYRHLNSIVCDRREPVIEWQIVTLRKMISRLVCEGRGPNRCLRTGWQSGTKELRHGCIYFADARDNSCLMDSG